MRRWLSVGGGGQATDAGHARIVAAAHGETGGVRWVGGCEGACTRAAGSAAVSCIASPRACTSPRICSALTCPML